MKYFPKSDPIDLQGLFPGTEPEGVALLKKMLAFNPEERITCADAIKDPWFDDVRLPEQETTEDTEPIELEFDRAESAELSLEELRAMALDEIKQVSHLNFDFMNDFAEELCEDY